MKWIPGVCLAALMMLQAQELSVQKDKWHLFGAVGDISNMSVFTESCVKSIYQFEKQTWNLYEPTGEQEISQLSQGKGFWLKALEDCEISTSVLESATGSSYSFTLDEVDFGIPGVSPEAILKDGKTWLYVTDEGMKLYEAEDGLNFEKVADLTLQGSDPTVIPQSDGTCRMYYVQHNRDMETGLDAAEIRSALSEDGISWSDEGHTGITNESGNDAWGVPDTILTPEGNVRLYWVSMTDEKGAFEVILSALSEDGQTFTEESGYRTEDGYVDPCILLAEEGNWVGLFATTPAEERLPQKIYVGTSTDGLTWQVDSEAIIAVSGKNNLDPTAVPLGNNQYRIYFSASPEEDPFSDWEIKSGVLTIN